jgi:hypothetical protein
MSLYDSLLTRLQSLPLSITSLNALVPLLTVAFSRIPPPALGPAAFIRFFNSVHARLAALPNAYSDELRMCVDACARCGGREWPSGMVPLSSSSQTQTQLHMNGHLTIEVPVSPTVFKGGRRQIPYLQSIEVIIRTPHPGHLLKRISCGTVARNYPRLPMCLLTRRAGRLVTCKISPKYPRIVKRMSQIA